MGLNPPCYNVLRGGAGHLPHGPQRTRKDNILALLRCVGRHLYLSWPSVFCKRRDPRHDRGCLLYTSDAADDTPCVDL
eukprot:6879069-Pyramimonas_sp.AAC.1